jgi:hypothetical protein
LELLEVTIHLEGQALPTQGLQAVAAPRGGLQLVSLVQPPPATGLILYLFE